jgi:uncharacterized membrane protein
VAHFEHAGVQFRRRLEPTRREAAKAGFRKVTIRNELPRMSEKAQEDPAFPDLTSHCQSVMVNAPASEVYRRCLCFEDLPRFITSVSEIHKVNDTRFLCTVVINGHEVKTLVQILMRVRERRIAWQVFSDNFPVGVITFDPLRGGRTKVTVKIRSIIEPGLLNTTLRQYLNNFKLGVEADVVRV